MICTNCQHIRSGRIIIIRISPRESHEGDNINIHDWKLLKTTQSATRNMEPSTYGLSIDKCLHWNCLKLTNNFGMSSPLLCFYPRWWTRYSPQNGSVRPQSPQVLLQPAMIGIITEFLMVLLLPLSFLASAALRELWPKRLLQSNLARDSPDLKVSLRAICARCYSNTMGKPSKESKVVWNFPSPCLIARGYLWESSFFSQCVHNLRKPPT